MKIITYNVNGLRAAVSKGLPEWLAKEQPDVLCLQETKLQPEQYPAEALDALGYRHYLHSARKKGYSGVAILTKREPDHVEYGMGMEEYDSEGRFVRADYGDLSVVSVYHPSGTSGDERQAFKMEWLEHFRHYAVELLRTREGCLVRLSIGNRQFVTLSGKAELAQPLQTEWLIATPKKPETVQYQKLLALRSYSWMPPETQYTASLSLRRTGGERLE